MKVKNLLTVSLSFLLLACGGEKEAAPIVSVPVATSNAAKWETSIVSSNEYGKFQISKANVQQIEVLRNEYRATDLLSYPVDPIHNVDIFTIDNISEYKEYVFVAPRVFSYGSTDKQRSAPRRNNDGTVSMSFNLIATTGMSKSIPAPNGRDSIDIPKHYQIKNISELRKNLGNKKIAKLPGCPKHLFIIVEGKEYPVATADLRNGDYCQSDMPFTATVTLPESEARHMLHTALYNNTVDIRMMYETRVAFSVTKLKLTFNRQKLFTQIKARLAVKYGWADADARVNLQKVFENQSIALNARGQMTSDHIQTLIAHALNEFMEEFTPNPEIPEQACGKPVCLKVAYNRVDDRREFSLTWQHSENAMTGQYYPSIAKLQPLNEKKIEIGIKDEALALNSDDFRETGLTAVSGDLLEIEPSYTIRERREVLTPVRDYVNRVVCARSVKEKICEEWSDVSHRCLGAHYVNRCVEHRNEFRDITRYGLKKSVLERDDNPIGKVKILFDGLALKFTSRSQVTGEVLEIECPLNSFKREADGVRITVNLENSGACSPFKKGFVDPMVHLVNRIKFPQVYKDGVLQRNRAGAITSEPVEKVYQQKLKFAGSISIRGYGFRSRYLGSKD